MQQQRRGHDGQPQEGTTITTMDYMMQLHARVDRYPWGRGRFGWRPDLRPNVGGGWTVGWLNVQVWTTTQSDD
jgi:hypothetical protein